MLKRNSENIPKEDIANYNIVRKKGLCKDSGLRVPIPQEMNELKRSQGLLDPAVVTVLPTVDRGLKELERRHAAEKALCRACPAFRACVSWCVARGLDAPSLEIAEEERRAAKAVHPTSGMGDVVRVEFGSR